MQSKYANARFFEISDSTESGSMTAVISSVVSNQMVDGSYGSQPLRSKARIFAIPLYIFSFPAPTSSVDFQVTFPPRKKHGRKSPTKQACIHDQQPGPQWLGSLSSVSFDRIFSELAPETINHQDVLAVTPSIPIGSTQIPMVKNLRPSKIFGVQS